MRYERCLIRVGPVQKRIIPGKGNKPYLCTWELQGVRYGRCRETPGARGRGAGGGKAGGKMTPHPCPAVAPGLYLAHCEAREMHSDPIWSPETTGGGIEDPTDGGAHSRSQCNNAGGMNSYTSNGGRKGGILH